MSRTRGTRSIDPRFPRIRKVIREGASETVDNPQSSRDCPVTLTDGDKCTNYLKITEDRTAIEIDVI